MYKDKIILITGGTGSWGQVLSKRLIDEDVKEIRILSRNELSQVNMQREFNDKKVKYIIGDVRDIESLNIAMKDVDYVFHLAALKHVPICELHPKEAILTNINGTENIIKASINNKVKKVIDVSTDKAVSPHNVYGMTKAIGEKLIIHANTLTDETEFVCIRGGNVIGSNGSVIPFFINQIKKYNLVTITHKEMTRFFISLEEAIELLIKASQISNKGDILVMNMPSYKILDLAQVLIDRYGDENTRIEEIGLRPGEKLHEELVSKYESINTYCINNDYYLIRPEIEINNINTNYNYDVKVDFHTFDSSLQTMDKNEIRNKLKESGFI